MKVLSVPHAARAMIPRVTPVRPRTVKCTLKPIAYSIGASYEIEPLYMVAVQLKTFTADGMATRKLKNEKIIPAYGDWPLTNMWWPHTRNPRTAMPRLANATK